MKLALVAPDARRACRAKFLMEEDMTSGLRTLNVALAITTLFIGACTKSQPEQDPSQQQLIPGQEAPAVPGQQGQPTTPPAPVESNNGVPANGLAATGAAAVVGAPALPPVQPYRTWISLEGFVMEQNGDPSNPISNVRLEVTFPGGQRLELPGNGQYWTIGNGQMQEIKQTYEIPWSAIQPQKDGFNFTVQMIRKGSELLPCKFDVGQLSQFNRKYTCHTDVAWQLNQKTPEAQIEKEGIEVRVFTDKNTPAKDIPKDALAFR